MVVWFARGIVWRGEVPFFRDLSTYFYPLRFVLWQAFQNWQLPLWDRHFAMGFPVLADFESAVFYPPHLLFLPLSLFSAVRVSYVFHYLAAVTGTYFLFRHWSYPRHQAIVGAVLFTFGGAMVSLINLLNHFQSAVWLPWTLLFWLRFLYRRTWLKFIVLILILAVQLLAGSPEIYAFTMILLLLSTVSAVTFSSRDVFRCILFLIVANLALVLLASAQLLPTVELFLESRRQEPIPMQEALSWSLNPWRLVNLFLLDKTVDLNVGDGTQLFFDRDIPLFVTHYLGAVCFFGITFWAVVSSLKERLVLTGLTVCFLFLSFGAFTPVYPLLYKHVGIFRVLRYPEKFFFLVQAILIFAAMRGLFEFEARGFERARTALKAVVLGGLPVMIGYIILRANPALLTGFIISQKGLSLPPAMTYDYAASVLVSLERQFVICAALFAVFWAGGYGYLSSVVYRVLFVAIVFVDLSWAHEGFQYLLKPDRVFGASKVLERPDSDPNRIFYYPSAKNLHAGAFVIRRPPSTAFDQIYGTVASNLLPNSGVALGFDYMQDINALAKSSYVEFLKYANQVDQEKQFRLLGALNVKYVVSFQPIRSPGATLIREFPEYPSWLYQIDRVIPRVYIVSAMSRETDPPRILRQLSSETFNPHREILSSGTRISGGHDGPPGQAQILKYENQFVIIQAENATAGVLVLADSFYPGWRVYVDGKEEQLFRANYFFRGVNLATGKHLVEFKYEPYSFKIGSIISLLTATSLILVSVFSIVIRRGWVNTENLYRWGVPALALRRLS